MALGTVWTAREAEVHIIQAGLAAAALTSTTQSLYQGFQGAGTEKVWTGRCKDLRITAGGRDITAQNVLGTTQLEQENRPEMYQAELTLVYDDASAVPYMAGTPSVTTVSVTGGTNYHNVGTSTFTRYQMGEKATAAADRQRLAVMFVITNNASSSNKTVYALLNNATCVGRDLSLGAEGHVEETLRIKCLASNYFEEDNFTASV